MAVMKDNHTIGGGCVIIISLLLVLSPAGGDAANVDSMMAFENNRVSLNVKNADMKGVLIKLAETAGFYVRMPTSLDQKITINLRGRTLKNALKRILNGMNHAIVYSHDPVTNAIRVCKVYVFKKTGPRAGAFRDRISPTKQKMYQNRISNLERQIVTLRKNMSSAGRHTPQGKRYLQRIKNYERMIRRFENLIR